MLTYTNPGLTLRVCADKYFPSHILFLFQCKIRIEVVNNHYSFGVPFDLYTQCKGLRSFQSL